MITGQLRSKIDKLWEEFWTGGITNPLTVIEQISFLMFARLLDMRESTEEKKWARKNASKPFPGVYFARNKQHLRWSKLKQEADPEKVLKIVRDEVFPHFRSLGQQEVQTDAGPKNTFGQYMKDASLMINKPPLLMKAINMIESLPLTQGDTKGDLYEYLLSKLTTAGINGQFRTPRHIISLMVDLVLMGNHDAALSWTVGDPACGTGGFLVQFMQALREHFTSPAGIHVDPESGDKTYTADLIEPRQWKHIKSDMFHGFDFDVTMLRIAAMNLMLHEIDTPDINYQDTLSTNFTDRKETRRWAQDAFDLILANPPFKGSLDEEDVHKSLTGKVKTKKTELLFLMLMLRMLKLGGRCAVIVPDGVLFGSSNAHMAVRKLLVEEHQLEAVVKLPAGVFKPYAGVSTAILLFTKGGRTTDVWFYDVQADGFSLDDKRDPVETNDLPDVRTRWAQYHSLSQKESAGVTKRASAGATTSNSLSPREKAGATTSNSLSLKGEGRGEGHFADRKAKAFSVPKAEIAENKYDLSLNRYKEIVHEEVQYDPPQVIIGRLKKLEAEIAKDLEELERMLG